MAKSDEKASTATVPPDQLRKIVAESLRLKELAGSYSENRTSYHRTQIARYELNKAAFALAVRLNAWDVVKRDDFLYALLDYGISLGFFDQKDLFGGLRGRLEEAVDPTQDADWEDADPVAENAARLRDGISLLSDLTAA